MSLLLRFFFFITLSMIIMQPSYSQQKNTKPVKIAVVGLVHDHVHWIMGRANQGDVEIVAIVEPNQELVQRYAKQYKFDKNLVYDNLEEMLDEVKPEAVTAFNSIYDHLKVVQACAPRGVHVMVEKPLAVSVAHATEMAKLAREANILLITNYETTWYGSNHTAYQMIHEKNMIGEIRKVVVHDGHKGPKEIGVSDEFFAWLTDPELNGGGAIIDFGCYGADLITWLMQGQRPISVTAVTQQIKPEIYPKVDDEATIILTYPETQGIIQASWNWPYNRKDMEVYGQTGYIMADNKTDMRVLESKSGKELKMKARPPQFDDPFAYLAALVRGEIKIEDNDLSSLETNLTVVEILEAARTSASSGKTVKLKP